MKQKIKTLLAISGAFGALLAGAPAHAENWQSLGDSDQSTLLVDTDSIVESGGIREAWSMWNFKEARPNTGDTSFPSLKSYKDLHQYNCKAGTMKLVREIIFAENDGKGDKRDHSDALKGMEFTKPKPMSVGDAMMQAVCGYEIKKK
ncbi:surface-adhesin E family protein [Herbaspirillum chlorophenolicum]|uniref:Surface-adhesin E family protein n=1 Tax=Herbaspirillum chlorophenolicum TaxID=211589 RepID=A0ABW8EY33_9BURK|nr:surface-adhesin E family protein [Herbaspirillum chlorophenolicum]